MANGKPRLDLGFLEEDDEFEEFPVEGMGKIMNIRCQISTYLYKNNYIYIFSNILKVFNHVLSNV